MRPLEIYTRPSLEAALVLLGAAGLPAADLTESHFEHFLFCGSAEAPTGLVGLEIFDRDALLRSLAVAPAEQGTGLGSTLVRRAEHHAREKGVGALRLLTTTAQHFFEKRGYYAVSRKACPEAIRSTSQFASLCPASSTLLMKALT